MSILDKIHANLQENEPIGSLALESLASGVVSRGNIISPNTALNIVTGKATDDSHEELRLAMQSLQDEITASARDGFKPTAAQIKAGVYAGLISATPQAALRHLSMESTGLTGIALGKGDAAVTMFSRGLSSRAISPETLNKAFESYDANNGRNMQTWSIAWNTQASQQDAFGEAFFNTITLDPAQSAYHVTTIQRNVMRDATRSLNGAVTDWQRTNLIDAYRDSSVLRNESTKMIPVWNDLGAEDTKSDSFFVDAAKLPPREVSYMGETVKTSALAFGKQFDLISLCSTKTLVANGLLQVSDTLEPNIRLGAVYMEIDGKIVKFGNVHLMTSATATPSINGDTENFNINFQQALPITAATKSVDNAVHAGLAFLEGYTARLNITVFGTISRDVGTTSLSAGEVTISRVTSDDGVVVPLNSTAAPMAELKTKVATAKLLGFDLPAYRSNSNLRQRGRLIERRATQTYYAVNNLSPLSSVRPINQGEENDQAVIQDLVSATRVFTSNTAVTSLLEYASLLKEYSRVKDKQTDDYPDALGAARSLVKATYVSGVLDVQAITGNLHSSDKLQDLQQQITLTLRDLATRMLVESNYAIALDILYGGGSQIKPKLVIGTDQYTAAFLMKDGDPRTLSEVFDFKIVYTVNKEMEGKMLISFIDPQVENKGIASPLNFGNMVWSPEIVTAIPAARGGQISHELTVHPKFLHVCNLPIMGELVIEGIAEYVNTKPAFLVDNLEVENPAAP